MFRNLSRFDAELLGWAIGLNWHKMTAAPEEKLTKLDLLLGFVAEGKIAESSNLSAYCDARRRCSVSGVWADAAQDLARVLTARRMTSLPEANFGRILAYLPTLMLTPRGNSSTQVLKKLAQGQNM